MPEYVTAAIVAGSSLVAQGIARVRCIFRPGVGCVSGCTEFALEHGEDHEVDIQKVDLHGRQVIIVTARA